MAINGKGYLELLRERRKDSRAYHRYQAVGAELAEILRDAKHTALYIKLAKERDPEALLALAKSIALRKGIKNRGAYFMRILHSDESPK